MEPIDLLDVILADEASQESIESSLTRVANGGLISSIELLLLRRSMIVGVRDDLFRVADVPAEFRTFCDAVRGLSVVGGREPRAAWSHATFRSAEVLELPLSRAQWHANPDPFSDFCSLFQRRLKEANEPSVHLIAAALEEMASNAVEHSETEWAGIAAFEVIGSQWSFIVGDVGMGIANHLRRLPAFANLGEADAVAAAIAGASGTGVAGRGNGYRALFQALGDRRCRIRLRTGSVAMAWQGESPTSRNADLTSLPRRQGCCVSVARV